MKLSIEKLQQVLNNLDGGVLYAGKHTPNDHQFCALELVTVARGLALSDSPSKAAMPDIRPLNDASWRNNEARTAALLPLIASLSDWNDWTFTQQQTFIEAVVRNTVRQIIATLPNLPTRIVLQCQTATTMVECRIAAYAAASAVYAVYAADAAARAADAAARAAGAAANAAASAAASAAARAANAADAADAARAARAANAAADAVLDTAVSIWINAAKANSNLR